MTEATQTRPHSPQETEVTLHYQVAMPQPESHLFEVTLAITGWRSPELNLRMPVWTPGSYLVREYARHLQDFSAIGSGQPLLWQKEAKNRWQIKTAGHSSLTIRYRVFANELSVRTNHLDSTHGYFNGAALFFFIPGFERHPVQVTVVPPRPDWQVTTALPEVPDQAHTFEATDFDHLVDSPFEVGIHQVHDFVVLGKPHRLAIWGQGNADAQRIIQDTQKVIEAEAELFGGLPYDRYLFLLHLSAQGFGGLEHKDSCSLNYPRFGFRVEEKYQRFIQLVAHEFFHLWNVKRIRPKALEVFDYEAENYTPSLWFSEGVTSFYDLLIPLRAGIYDAKTYLHHLGKNISRYLSIPGRHVQPLRESSFDAWIKLYRRDANSDNSQISYYLKGELVALLLDLLIRQRHNNQRSLDQVLVQLWEQFGKDEVGFTPQQLQAIIEDVAGTDLTDFFVAYLDRTDELPLNDYLAPFGLRLTAEKTNTSYLGARVESDAGRAVIKYIETGSPAQQAGLDADDELLAIAGFRVTAETLSDRLQDYQPGDAIEVTAFHQEELRTYTVTLGHPQPTPHKITVVDQPSPAQATLFEGWLGEPLSNVQS